MSNNFTVGQMVTWNTNEQWPFENVLLETQKERLGDGPFEVKEVLTTPKEMLKGVGHDQCLLVQLGERSYLFSGAYFRPHIQAAN